MPVSGIMAFYRSLSLSLSLSGIMSFFPSFSFLVSCLTSLLPLQDTSMHCLCSDCRDSCTATPDVPEYREWPMVGSVDVFTFTLIIVYCVLSIAIIIAACTCWNKNDGGEEECRRVMIGKGENECDNAWVNVKGRRVTEGNE